jgi:hypothetical protein
MPYIISIFIITFATQINYELFPCKYFMIQHSASVAKPLTSFCGNSASLTKLSLLFAGSPQVTKSPRWRLREVRKSHRVLVVVCGNSASLTKPSLLFAGTPQVSRSLRCRLRELKQNHFYILYNNKKQKL